MWGLDPPKIAPKTALFQFSVAASIFGSIMLFAYASTPEMPAVPRSYPYDGLVKELGGNEANKVLSSLGSVYIPISVLWWLILNYNFV